ncbi:MAG: immunity 22 family protein, partial [Bacteroidota bacterium]
MWTKAHFWLGHFQSEEDLHQYFAEHYDEDGELLSFAFATDQSLSFCDHDFLEYGFEPEGETLAVKFSGYSYSEDWLETLQERAHG